MLDDQPGRPLPDVHRAQQLDVARYASDVGKLAGKRYADSVWQRPKSAPWNSTPVSSGPVMSGLPGPARARTTPCGSPAGQRSIGGLGRLVEDGQPVPLGCDSALDRKDERSWQSGYEPGLTDFGYRA